MHNLERSVADYIDALSRVYANWFVFISVPISYRDAISRSQAIQGPSRHVVTLSDFLAMEHRDDHIIHYNDEAARATGLFREKIVQGMFGGALMAAEALKRYQSNGASLIGYPFADITNVSFIFKKPISEGDVLDFEPKFIEDRSELEIRCLVTNDRYDRETAIQGTVKIGERSKNTEEINPHFRGQNLVEKEYPEVGDHYFMDVKEPEETYQGTAPKLKVGIRSIDPLLSISGKLSHFPGPGTIYLSQNGEFYSSSNSFHPWQQNKGTTTVEIIVKDKKPYEKIPTYSIYVLETNLWDTTNPRDVSKLSGGEATVLFSPEISKVIKDIQARNYARSN